MLVLWWMRVKVYMQEGLIQAKEWQGEMTGWMK